MERSLFLNALIDRKAISWTKLFADLEKVVPYNVRLVSVRLRKWIQIIAYCWTWWWRQRAS